MANRTRNVWTRYGLMAAASLILVFQASAYRLLKIDETKIGIPGLHSIPMQIGQWQSSGEGSMDAATTAYLRPDEYILRDYSSSKYHAQINLFVAYFKSLQNSYGPHSPSICLPGSGWLVSSYKISQIPVAGHPDGIPVNEFTMEQGDQHIRVLYWYQNDRNIWAREFRAKLLLLPDLIRYRRSDESLVRLVSPMGGVLGDNRQACIAFAKRIFPLLAERFASVH